MTIHCPAAPEIALALSDGSESIDPVLAEAFATFDAISANWPAIDAYPSSYATPEAPERFNGVDAEETPRDQVEAPVLPAAKTTPEETTPKGWLSRVHNAIRASGEWATNQRAKVACAVGFLIAPKALSEGQETLGVFGGTIGGVTKGFMELIGTPLSEHAVSTGAFSAASFSAIGVGLAMRKGLPRRSQPKPGEVGLSELMAPGRQQLLDHAAFAERLAYYQGVIRKTDNALQHPAEQAYAG